MYCCQLMLKEQVGQCVVCLLVVDDVNKSFVGCTKL